MSKNLKTIVMLVGLLAGAGCAKAFAWGVGVEGGLPLVGGLPGSNVMLSAKFDNLPLLGVGLGLNNAGLSNVGVIADFWLIQEPLAGALGVFVGPGLYLSLSTQGTPTFAAGARLPIGLQIFPLRWFELFVEVAPAIGGVFTSSSARFDWNLQAAAGLRFWFN